MERISEKIVKYKRYIKYGIQYFVMEKMRGLDFTMRDTHLLKETAGRLHGYSKTNEKHLKEIFDYLQIDENDKLLDVGCGKGVVLREAAQYPFATISGIDIDGNLIRIAKKNFQILKLEDRITCEEKDALLFEHYSDYNIFFFFNPFGQEIFNEVLNKIVDANRNRKKICIIYHNPVFADAIDNLQCFVKEKEMFDSSKHYKTYIFCSRW